MVAIVSLLDTDLYKFTMMQAVLHQHPGAVVQYRFKCRTPGIDLARYIDEIDTEIDALCALRFTADELAYMRGEAGLCRLPRPVPSRSQVHRAACFAHRAG